MCIFQNLFSYVDLLGVIECGFVRSNLSYMDLLGGIFATNQNCCGYFPVPFLLLALLNSPPARCNVEVWSVRNMVTCEGGRR